MPEVRLCPLCNQPVNRSNPYVVLREESAKLPMVIAHISCTVRAAEE